MGSFIFHIRTLKCKQTQGREGKNSSTCVIDLAGPRVVLPGSRQAVVVDCGRFHALVSTTRVHQSAAGETLLRSHVRSQAVLPAWEIAGLRPPLLQHGPLGGGCRSRAHG